MGVYKEPLYYEIAFSFIDAKKQVDLFERFIRKYSRIPVRRVLDIGCGPSLQLREIARRGYEAVGLDASPRMLKYLEAKAGEEGVRIETIRADMMDFRLKKKADFACAMMGTISYIRSNGEFLRHLDSVAASLRKGGLYLIEEFRLDWGSKKFFTPSTWTMKRDGIRVKTTYDYQLKDALKQTVVDFFRLDVDDHGRRGVFEDRTTTKLIFPQELVALIEHNGKFEFLGWFERDRMRKLTRANLDNITLLRRR
ncbi:MAG: class I SAM-dependent methyltransferase [Candidatus Latescibacteria bacterium]|nr:class I SAM-dependent methyltransferase [Candidatus Latescibacterota bacterium]